MREASLGEWSARIARIENSIRSRVEAAGSLIMWHEVLSEEVDRLDLGFPYQVDRRTAQQVPDAVFLEFGIAEFLTHEAFRRMENAGEISPFEGGIPLNHLNTLATAKGWYKPTSWSSAFRAQTHWVATVRGVQLAEAMTTGPSELTIWDEVDELIAQSRLALVAGLAVAAAVVGRTAVEQAIRHALDDLGQPFGDQDPRAWKREDEVFARLSKASSFGPMDRAATLATLSGIRDLGNEAAHTGSASDQMRNWMSNSEMHRACLSLYSAVQASKS